MTLNLEAVYPDGTTHKITCDRDAMFDNIKALIRQDGERMPFVERVVLEEGFMFCDEDGLALRLPQNFPATRAAQRRGYSRTSAILVGPVVFSEVDLP